MPVSDLKEHFGKSTLKNKIIPIDNFSRNSKSLKKFLLGLAFFLFTSLKIFLQISK
jgi:mannitol-1-phosphate/altronate dehydrogenase